MSPAHAEQANQEFWIVGQAGDPVPSAMVIAALDEATVTHRPRRNHSLQCNAKVAPAALSGQLDVQLA